LFFYVEGSAKLVYRFAHSGQGTIMEDHFATIVSKEVFPTVKKIEPNALVGVVAVDKDHIKFLILDLREHIDGLAFPQMDIRAVEIIGDEILEASSPR
jgi:hypothetical protein